MKRKLKLLVLTGLLAAAMVVTAACGVEFDASGYVKSFMDMMCKGEIKEYTKFTGVSEEDAKKEYEELTDSMMDPLKEAGMSEDVQKRFRDVYIELFARSKYTVKEAKKTGDDEYTVDVVIEPIEGIYDGLSEEMDTEASNYIQEQVANGQEIDETKASEWVFNTMLDKMEARMDSITYGDPVTVTCKVIKDGNTYKVEDEEKFGEEVGKNLIDQSSIQ